MAVENDFLPFAVGGSANVLTQDQYAALTSLLQNGFQSGIANSQQLNKVWRQSSIMGAVLAQFIAQQTGENVIDDGTTATLLANLTSAVSASVPGVVGQSRNLTMSVTAASATATLTADEIIVESGLGGLRYCLANFSETINLATTGAGGMDTGSAPTSGFVALYAIFNPATGAKALLATNATATKQPEVYGGAYMPNGYTASALVSVWPTNSSGQFGIAFQFGRVVNFSNIIALSATALQTITSLSIAAIVPKNAVGVTGEIGLTNNSTGNNNNLLVAASTALIGQKNIGLNFTSITGGMAAPMDRIPLITPQTLYYSVGGTGGTLNAVLQISGYDF